MRLDLSAADLGKLESHFGPLNKSQTNWRAGKVRFGRRGSVLVDISGDRVGFWRDFEGDRCGSLSTLLPGLELPEFDRRGRGRDCLAFVPDEREAVLKSVLGGRIPAAGTATERYLTSRGVVRWPEMMVWHSTNPFGMCSIAMDGGGVIIACQVVHLTDDGRKANVSVKKRTFCAGQGWHETAAVRLPGRGSPVLCEGVETGLSIWQATGRTVLCCLGTAGLLRLRIKARRLIIARDGDEPGSPADKLVVRAARERANHGVTVTVAMPPIGMDFNDVLRQRGEREVARMIKDAGPVT